MDEGEFRELLQHLRSELRRSGLAVVEAEVSSEWGIRSQDGARYALLDYLDLLETALRLRSRGTVDEIVGLVNEAVDSSSESPLRGIVVELSEAETIATGRSQVDLLDLPDLSDTLESLLSLRAELAES